MGKKSTNEIKLKKLPVKLIEVSESDDHLGHEISIKCEGADLIELDHLQPFQGNLKLLTEDAYCRLKKSILELGFSFPIAAWKFRNKVLILDAHQRVETLNRMREEGYSIPKLPVVWVEAIDHKEAAKKLLAVTSQYGEMQIDGLHSFMKEFQLTMPDIENIFKFPEIDLFSFKMTFFPETETVSFDAKKEWKGMPEFTQEDKGPFRSIIVHFFDQNGVDKFADLMKQYITEKTRMLWFPNIIIEKAADKRYGNFDEES